MERKPLPPASYFIEKLERMRQGMLDHMDEASNETSVIGNFVKIFGDGFLRRAHASNTPDEFFEALGKVFVLDTDRENKFVQQCLDKAIKKMQLTSKEEFFFKGNFTDALMRTNMGYQPAIKHLINIHRPFNWKTPKEREQDRSLDRLAERLKETGDTWVE